ncbi:hypothetical protein, partial [Mycoplasmopsis verecunda]
MKDEKNWFKTRPLLGLLVTLLGTGAIIGGVFAITYYTDNDRKERKGKLHDTESLVAKYERLEANLNNLKDVFDKLKYKYYSNVVGEKLNDIEQFIKETKKDLIKNKPLESDSEYWEKVDQYENDYDELEELFVKVYIPNMNIYESFLEKIQSFSKWIQNNPFAQQKFSNLNHVKQIISIYNNWYNTDYETNSNNYDNSKWLVDNIIQIFKNNLQDNNAIFSNIKLIFEESYNIKYLSNWSLLQEQFKDKYLHIMENLENFSNQAPTNFEESLNTVLDQISNYITEYNVYSNEIPRVDKYTSEYKRKISSLKYFLNFQPFINEYQTSLQNNKNLLEPLNTNADFKTIKQQFDEFASFINPILQKGYLLLGFQKAEYEPFKQATSEFKSYLASNVTQYSWVFDWVYDEFNQVKIQYDKQYVENKTNIQELNKILNSYKNQLINLQNRTNKIIEDIKNIGNPNKPRKEEPRKEEPRKEEPRKEEPRKEEPRKEEP